MKVLKIASILFLLALLSFIPKSCNKVTMCKGEERIEVYSFQVEQYYELGYSQKCRIIVTPPKDLE
jgi:hypothetical protein